MHSPKTLRKHTNNVKQRGLRNTPLGGESLTEFKKHCGLRPSVSCQRISCQRGCIVIQVSQGDGQNCNGPESLEPGRNQDGHISAIICKSIVTIIILDFRALAGVTFLSVGRIGRKCGFQPGASPSILRPGRKYLGFILDA